MGDFNAEPNEPAISNFCEIYNNKNIKRENLLQKFCKSDMHRSNLNKQTKEFPKFICY